MFPKCSIDLQNQCMYLLSQTVVYTSSLSTALYMSGYAVRVGSQIYYDYLIYRLGKGIFSSWIAHCQVGAMAPCLYYTGALVGFVLGYLVSSFLLSQLQNVAARVARYVQDFVF